MRTITTEKIRSLAAICLSFIIALSVSAQSSPSKMSYQAVVRDGTNSLLENKTVGMRISILQGSASGSVVYSETHSPTTNANGLISIIIGDGRVGIGAMALIDWSQGPFFAKTEIDPNGGSNYSITSTTQLLSVPFALYAEKAGNGFDGKYESLSGVPSFASVAETGEYDDLLGKPDLHRVAETGDYGDLDNTPQFADVATSGKYEDLSGKPEFTAVATSGKYEDLSGKPVLHGVATSGKYEDLANTPQLAPVATSGSYKSLTDTLVLADVARSGRYEDLIGKAAIPTKVGELENDANYLITERQELQLDGSELSITDEKGKVVNSVTLPSNSTGGVTDYEQLTNKPEGTNEGDILYWNNNEKKWNVLSMGLEGQFLAIANGKLAWTEPSFANTSASTYKVGDIYYDMVTKEPAGVVFEVSTVGRYSKIIALEDLSAKWATGSLLVNEGQTPQLALNETDGRKNSAIIKNRANWETDYPAFKTVSENMGDTWYIPAREELKAIWNNKESINKQLEILSGQPLQDECYWSSTEVDFVMITDDERKSHPYAWGAAMGEYKITFTEKDENGNEQQVTETIQSGSVYEEEKATEHLLRPARYLSWEETTSKPVDQLYNVGDIYYDADQQPLGIVISTTNGGLHGTLMSLDEATAKWFSATEFSEDLDMTTDSGYTNSQNCTNTASYDALKWCLDKNGAQPLAESGSWFLPSPDELKEIYLIFEFLNDEIAKIEGKIKLSEGNYWTSKADADSANNAYCISIKDGGISAITKSSECKVRAIYQF